MMIADENNAGGTEQSSEQNPDNTTTPETQTTPAEPAATSANAGNGGATEERPRRRRGFAAMDRDRVKEIASKGGKAAHSAGTAHQFSSEEARVAGRKGGMAPHVRRGGVRRRPTTEASAPAQGATGEPSSDGRQ